MNNILKLYRSALGFNRANSTDSLKVGLLADSSTDSLADSLADKNEKKLHLPIEVWQCILNNLIVPYKFNSQGEPIYHSTCYTSVINSIFAMPIFGKLRLEPNFFIGYYLDVLHEKFQYKIKNLGQGNIWSRDYTKLPTQKLLEEFQDTLLQPDEDVNRLIHNLYTLLKVDEKILTEIIASSQSRYIDINSLNARSNKNLNMLIQNSGLNFIPTNMDPILLRQYCIYNFKENNKDKYLDYRYIYNRKIIPSDREITSLDREIIAMFVLLEKINFPTSIDTLNFRQSVNNLFSFKPVFNNDTENIACQQFYEAIESLIIFIQYNPNYKEKIIVFNASIYPQEEARYNSCIRELDYYQTINPHSEMYIARIKKMIKLIPYKEGDSAIYYKGKPSFTSDLDDNAKETTNLNKFNN